MSNERELTKNMRAELRRNGIVGTLSDYEARRDHLIDILNDGRDDVLEFIPDFIMIDLLKEYKYSFGYYNNIDEFVEGTLGYKHGTVQLMRKIAKHFFVFNPLTKEYELEEEFRSFSLAQLEKMSVCSKLELRSSGVDSSMTVYEIDAIIRENGRDKSMRVTNEESKIIEAYRIADATVKSEIRKILKMY